ncbi:MAG TPA: plastocyanin/azurin family copper-binding protein [Thermoplasmata archaeon]|nr:plastocyanin/azurin family copper-binding protein [Thermoplasmata archaeon]
MEQGSGSGGWVAGKPFALWVIAGGLVYTALALLVYTLSFFSGATDLGLVAFLLTFIILFLIAAFFSLRARRWAYILGSVVGIILVLLFSFNIAASASNPADSGFWFTMSALPALFLVVLFSILSFRNAKAGLASKKYLATPVSSGGLLTIAVIGFVVGSLIAGAIGGGIILRTIASPPSDVSIVRDAAGKGMLAYQPTTFTVSVGGTVTWINRDITAHTVTSNSTDPGSPFDSGIMTTGVPWSHTFTVAGTYRYYCTIHPMMVATIVVV